MSPDSLLNAGVILCILGALSLLGAWVQIVLGDPDDEIG